MTLQRLWVPGELPGLNQLIEAKMVVRGAGKRRWSAYQKMKAEYEAKVRKQVAFQRFEQIVAPSYYTYLFRCPTQKRDPSNIIAGGIKILEDAMQGAEVMPGDGWRDVLGIAAHYVLDPQRVGVTVFVTQDRTLQLREVLELDQLQEAYNDRTDQE